MQRKKDCWWALNIFILLKGWTTASPVGINPNPPATQENIDDLPMVSFGKEPDQFNQTDW